MSTNAIGDESWEEAHTRVAHENARLLIELDAATRRLAESDGLWRYWTTHDITHPEERWIAFTNAVGAHLAGKPVPPRFVVRNRGELQR